MHRFRAPRTWLLLLPLLAGTAVPCGAAATRAGDATRPSTWPRRPPRLHPDSAPEIADWIRLQSAALSADSLERQALYAQITLPVARDRITATEAIARERLGDVAGAALRYDSIGRFTDATRLRLRQARTEAQRAGLRGGLLATVRADPGAPEALEAVRFLASPAVVLTPQEGLELARFAARNGLALEAALLYSRSIRRTSVGGRDLVEYGTALARLRRHREAITVFRRVPAGSEFGAEALLGEASSWASRGDRTSARRALDRIQATNAGDSAALASALFLRGKLAWDGGDHDAARTPWRELIQRFPRADSAGRAGFLAALALYEAGRSDQAGREWQEVQQLDRGPDGLAAAYWAGRALSESGDSAQAVRLWQSVLQRDSTSYYAYAAASQLGVPGWQPAPAAERFTDYPDLDSAMTRIARLEDEGMTEEAEWERAWLTAPQVRSAQRLLSLADAFRRAGDPIRAITTTRIALARGARSDARTYRLLYPRRYEQHLAAQAETIGVDPLVVAALIRQESAWNPNARSRVGARGLMQVMPSTGRVIARQLGVRGWRVDHLDEPLVNLRFGTFYLGQVLQKFNGDLIRALAAYNAGPGRVPQWSVGKAQDDPELFIELIGFRETRDYVRTIKRNVAVYRALYGKDLEGPAS